MTPLDKAYGTLELEPGASEDDVRRQYRLLVNVWHPDRFQGNQDLGRRATEKLKAINDAFSAIRAAGFPGNPSVPPERDAEHTTPEPRVATPSDGSHHSGQQATGYSSSHRRPMAAVGCLLAGGLVVLIVVALFVSNRTDRNAPTRASYPVAPVSPVETLPPPGPITPAEACDAGDAVACINLGAKLRTGDGVPLSFAAAATRFHSACLAGHPVGCEWLAHAYKNGEGVEASQWRSRRRSSPSGSPRDPV